MFPDIPLLRPPLRESSGVVPAKFTYAAPDPRALDRAAVRLTVFDRGAGPRRG